MDELSFSDFESASTAVMKFLHQRFGFALWMVTRQDEEDWIVLHSEDHGYDVEAGTVFRWVESFCSEMIRGYGPNIASCSASIPAYRLAKIGQQVKINAYVGYPLYRADGSVFGTLCGIDPHSQPAELENEQALIALLAKLLSTVLQADLSATETARRLERVQVESLTDSLTQLYNRRAWERFLSAEEERCRRYGSPATVLIVDLDGLKEENDVLGHTAGDKLLQRTAKVLRKAARQTDTIARLGGDEFGILSVECRLVGAGEALRDRTRAALAAADIEASVGIAARIPSLGLRDAWEKADKQMYEEKRSRHQNIYKS